MTLRDRPPKQLVAVSLALIMLLSVGAMSFVGGAAAQTGGTLDGVIDPGEETSVGDQLNVADEDVNLVAGNDVDDVTVGSDGTIDITGSAHSSTGEFAGVELTPDRIENVTSVDSDDATAAPTDFLSDLPDEFRVDSAGGDDGAEPVIFIEYDPQSEFSQIETESSPAVIANDNVRGEHDFIAIGPAGDGPNSGLGALFTDTNDDISDPSNDIVAVSVNNDELGSLNAGTASDATGLAEGDNFGTVIDDLVDQGAETDLQDKNIDDIAVTAGTFEDTTDADTTIQQVMLADDIDQTDFDQGDNGETIHHEKITLSEDGADDKFFASLESADTAAQNNNNAVITVDSGDYSTLEGGSVTLGTAGLTVETNADTPAGTTDIADRFDVDISDDSVSLADGDAEAVVSEDIDIDSDGITLDGLAVDDNGDPAIDVNADTANLSEVVVLNDASGGGTAVDVQDVADTSTTINNSAILEVGDPTAFDSNGEIGLDLDSDDNPPRSATVSGSYFVGFEQQITGLDNIDTPSLVDDNHDAFFTDNRTQLALVEDGSGTVQDVNTLYGAITDADDQAGDGDVIAVAPGTYEDTITEPVDIDTNNIVLDGTEGSDRPEVINDVNLDGSNNATVESLIVDDSGGIVNADTAGDSVTVRNTTLPADDTQIVVGAGDSVTIDTVNFTGTIDAVNNGNSVVEIDGDEPDVTVTDVSIEDLEANPDLTGINISTAGSVVSVTDTTVDLAGTTTGSPTGINVSSIDTASEPNGGLAAVVDINDNTLLNLSNGIGIDLAEGTGGSGGSLDVDGNEIRGGTTLTGVDYTLADTVGTNITANTIIGADVDGEDSSIGVEFEAVTVSGDGVISSGDATTLTFTDNVLSGHARIIEAEDDEWVSTDYDAIVGQTLVDGEDLNNTVGTLVVGPDGADLGGATYLETFGSISDLDDAESYLPGSVQQAAELVSNDGTPGDDDTTNVDVSSLEIQDPEISGVNSPDSYDEGDDAVNFPDEERLSLTGEGDAQAPLVENSQIVIDDTDAINNHSVSDLELRHDSGNPAIDVNGDANSQTTFTNLNVTSNDDGLVVNADESDVNVIEVRDSTFDVGADGIVLASATGDDRDGFVVDNVTLTGPGISSNTGLDLSNVDKPGKTDPALETELTVQDVDISDFEKQLVLSGALTDIDGINAQTVLNGNSSAVNAGDSGNVTITAGDFDQAVLVFDDDGTGDRDGLQSHTPGSDGESVIYGSIDTADSETDDEAILDVRAGTYDHGGSDVNLGDEHSVTVEGPFAGSAASDSLRGNAGDEAVIANSIDIPDDRDVTIDGVSILADNDPGVNVDTDQTVHINNTAITDDDGGPATGVNIVDSASVSLYGSFIGNHEAGSPVATGVYANDDGADLTTGESTTFDGGGAIGVDIDDLDDSTATLNGDVANFNTGVYVNDDTEVTVTGDVTDNDNNGIEVVADATLTATGATISDNGAEGILVDSGGATVDVDQSTVEDNGDAGAGIQLDAVADGNTHNITRTTFTDNADFAVNADLTEEATANLTLRGNAFEGAQAVTSTEEVDATLNYFGADNGPEASGGASVSDTVVYDPFLTDSADSGADSSTSVSDTESTKNFAHDIVISANSVTSIGFPATPASPLSGTASLADIVDLDRNHVTAYALIDGDFKAADKESTWQNEEIEAFDAFVIENNNNEAITARVTYANDPSAGNSLSSQIEYDSGVNFVAPKQAGTVEETLLVGQPADTVAQPFELGENLYGTDAAGVRGDFEVTPSPAGFGESFQTGAADRVVHPHAGYIVIVNNNDTAGNALSEQITTPDGPTAQNIGDRTAASSGQITNVDTGETYTDIQVATADVDDGERLEFGSGTYDAGSDVIIDNADVTLDGAGSGFTTIDGNVDVQAEDVRVRDLTVEGELTTSGQGTIIQQIDVVENSPGNIIINAPGVSVANAQVDKSITVNSNNATISNSQAGLVDVNAAGKDTTIDNVQSDSTTVAGSVEDSVTFSGDSSVPDDKIATVGETGFESDLDTAVGNAESGDTLLVGGGTFDPVTVGKSDLTLKAAANAEPTIAPAADIDAIDIDSAGVTVDGITVEVDGNARAVDIRDLDTADTAEAVTLTNNVFNLTVGDSDGTGIDTTGADNVDATIEDNTFEASGEDGEVFVDDAADVLTLTAIEDANTFTPSVVRIGTELQPAVHSDSELTSALDADFEDAGAKSEEGLGETITLDSVYTSGLDGSAVRKQNTVSVTEGSFTQMFLDKSQINTDNSFTPDGDGAEAISGAYIQENGQVQYLNVIIGKNGNVFFFVPERLQGEDITFVVGNMNQDDGGDYSGLADADVAIGNITVAS